MFCVHTFHVIMHTGGGTKKNVKPSFLLYTHTRQMSAFRPVSEIDLERSLNALWARTCEGAWSRVTGSRAGVHVRRGKETKLWKKPVHRPRKFTDAYASQTDDAFVRPIPKKGTGIEL